MSDEFIKTCRIIGDKLQQCHDQLEQLPTPEVHGVRAESITESLKKVVKCLETARAELESANLKQKSSAYLSHETNAQPPRVLVFSNINSRDGETSIDVSTPSGRIKGWRVSGNDEKDTQSFSDSGHITDVSSQYLLGSSNEGTSDSYVQQRRLLKQLQIERQERVESLSEGEAGVRRGEETKDFAATRGASSNTPVGGVRTLRQNKLTHTWSGTKCNWVAAKGMVGGTMSDEQLQAASEIMAEGGVATPEEVTKFLSEKNEAKV